MKLQSIKQLYGDKLRATDGEIGHIKDFYFDDQCWVIRYVVANTGTWLPGRQVLLSPHAFDEFHQSGKLLQVNLTRKQIQESPSIEWHKPVSRQYEENYYQYYGWPYYWQGSGLWGMSGIPNLALSSAPLTNEEDRKNISHSKGEDVHLRSTQAVIGYNLQASDGEIGHVCDFIMDTHSWAIRQLVIKIGPLLSGREVKIPTSKVHRINYKESTVFIHLTKEAVEQSPEHHQALEAALF